MVRNADLHLRNFAASNLRSFDSCCTRPSWPHDLPQGKRGVSAQSHTRNRDIGSDLSTRVLLFHLYRTRFEPGFYKEMKIHVLSDLHIDEEPFAFEPVNADLCIIAGDVSPRREDVVSVVHAIQRHYPVVFVPGNHEYYPDAHEDYGTPIQVVDAYYRRVLGQSFYQMDARTIGNLRIAGCTLWTDFFGRDGEAMSLAESVMPDFSILLAEDRQLFTTRRAADLHNRMRTFLKETKADVVVTHHAPT